MEAVTMTEKQQNAFNKIISALPDDCRELFREIAEYATSLGYYPKTNAKETYADFIKIKNRRTILKIDTASKPPRLAINFFALPEYPGIFYEAVSMRVDLLEQMGYTPRCWGCGKCDGTIGYVYALSDGRKGFLCGRGVIELPSFDVENVAEVKEALRIQDEFFMKHYSV